MNTRLRELLPLLACPTCRLPLEFEASQEAQGWLRCRACAMAAPVLRGMVLFTEARSGHDPLPDLDELAASLLGDDASYADYARDKFRRQLIDAYAAFEPFNEATRCLTPLLDAIQQTVVAGDAVLDLGNRAGWSGAMLSGRFAGQRVLSICGTGSGVLGYRGHRHWFADSGPASNLLMVFAPLDRPLPVREAAFALVHSHDCLHRSPDHSLFDEALRAASPAAPIIHAHIHLADVQPEPYFERGGILRLAAEYRQLLASRLADDVRVAVLLPESTLFLCTRVRALDWAALAGERGCNGVCVIASPALLERARTCCQDPPGPASHDRLLLNPLLLINALTGAVRIDDSGLGGRAMEMLERHPPFAQQLRDCLPGGIDATAMELLRQAETGASLAEAAHALSLPIAVTFAKADELACAGLVVAAPVPLTYQRLHRFHSNDASVFDVDLPGLLREWARQSPDAPGGVLLGGEINRADALDVVFALVRYFRRLGLGPGQPVAFSAVGSDAIWPLLACVCLGVPLAATSTVAANLAITDQADAAWSQQLCLSEAGGAAPTLGEVLSAYLATDADPVGDRESVPDGPTPGWQTLIGLDGKGRLRRRAGVAAT